MLSKDWITEGLSDFEYKQYVLLAWLKNVKERFARKQLYPDLPELEAHYRNMQAIISSYSAFITKLPGELIGTDLENQRLIYEKDLSAAEAMNEILDIVAYALPQLDPLRSNGRSIYQEVEQHLSIDPVGIVPLYKREGYFILSCGRRRSFIYRFRISGLDMNGQPLSGISTRFIKSTTLSPALQSTQIKLELINSYRELPNPATFVVNCSMPVPIYHTLLPISSELVLRAVAA
ncbi:MAG: hypothetical protein V4616_14255 [Bacteroidota bacterium]